MCNMLSPKDFIPDPLKSHVVYKFTCVCYGATDVFKHVNEHLSRHKNTHVFKHLSFSKNCLEDCNASCSKIIDNAISFHPLRSKRAFIWSS